MEYSVIVAGTGFDGRAPRIRLAVRPGMTVNLVPEPENAYDRNAIAVYLPVRRWFTLFMQADVHIGYIKKSKAALFSRKMAEGGKIINARVKSTYMGLDHPRVSVLVRTDW